MNIHGEVRYSSTRTTHDRTFENWVVIVQNIADLSYVAVTTDVNGSYNVDDIPVGTYHVTTRKEIAGQTYPETASWNNASPGTELFETIIPEITDLPGLFPKPYGATHVDFISVATGVAEGTSSGQTFVYSFLMAPLKREYFPYPVGKTPTGGNLITDADNGKFTADYEPNIINRELPSNPYPGVTNMAYESNISTSDPLGAGMFTITNTRTMGGMVTFNNTWHAADRTGMEESGFMVANMASINHLFRSSMVFLEPNTEYAFTAWFMGIQKAEPNIDGMMLDLAGGTVGRFSIGTLPGSSDILEWKQLGVVFNSGPGGGTILTIVPGTFSALEALVAVDKIRLEKLEEETKMCEFTEIQNWGPADTTAVDEETLKYAITQAQAGVPYLIELQNPITIESVIEIPSGTQIKITGHSIDAQENCRIFEMHGNNAILHLENIQLMHGEEEGVGGGAVTHQGFTDGSELVLNEGTHITNCSGAAGGGVFGFGLSIWINGAIIDNCHAVGDPNNPSTEAICGGVMGNCVLMTSGSISNCDAKYIGGLGAATLEMTGGSIMNNRAEAGAGVAVLENGIITGDAVIAQNIAQGDGGGIYKNSEFAPIYPGGGGKLEVSGTVVIENNISGGNGGGIFLTHQDLPNLTIAEGVEFRTNTAGSETTSIHPLDQPTYDATIFATVWSGGRPFGYNNLDIAYQADSDTCGGVGEQMIQMSQPVRVRPFTKVGTVVSRCCGPAWTTNGIDPQPPTPIENCDFTLSQRICVEVPVEFGAEVEVLPAQAECTGENCDTCEQVFPPQQELAQTLQGVAPLTATTRTACASGKCGTKTTTKTEEGK